MLAELVHPRATGEERFLMFEAYVDESGIHEGALVCVVCGYYGSRQQWLEFEERWDGILKLFEVGYFHSTQFWGRDKQGRRVGPYESWDDKRADDFLEQLVSCIEKSPILPVAHGIVIADWMALPKDARRFMTGGQWRGRRFRKAGSPNKPYYVPFQFCVLEPILSVRPNVVHYFFGLDKSFAGQALELFNGMKSLQELPEHDLLGQISFPLSKDTSGLQAADLLTYRVAQQSEALARTAHPAVVDSALPRLLSRDRIRNRRILLTTPGLERMLALDKERVEAEQSAIHASITCVVCQKLRTPHQPRPHSEDSEDTSRREKDTIAHTVFRYGRYIESVGVTCVPWRLGGARLPIYDPREEEE